MGRVPTVFATIAEVLPAVGNILVAVSDVFSSIHDILPPISDILASVTPILPTIVPILVMIFRSLMEALVHPLAHLWRHIVREALQAIMGAVVRVLETLVERLVLSGPPLLTALHQRFIALGIGGSEVLKPPLDLLATRLRQLLKLLRIVVLQPLEPTVHGPAAQPMVRFGVRLFEARQTILQRRFL